MGREELALTILDLRVEDLRSDLIGITRREGVQRNTNARIELSVVHIQEGLSQRRRRAIPGLACHTRIGCDSSSLSLHPM